MLAAVSAGVDSVLVIPAVDDAVLSEIGESEISGFVVPLVSSDKVF